MTDYKGIKAFEELIEKDHGVIGSDSRNAYEEDATRFIVVEMHEEARKESMETQEQLDEKAGFQLPE